MCEHPVVTPHPVYKDRGGWATTVWWLRCMTCPVEAVYVEFHEPATT